MKALLICPSERPALRALAPSAPLAGLPILGKSLIEYWLEDLALRRVDLVHVLASDRVEQIHALVGDGARWGLRIEIAAEFEELCPDEARAKYRADGEPGWLPAPEDAVVMDHLPALPGLPLFASCAGWFAALQEWMPRASTPDRVGLREIAPGVWAGLHAHVSRGAVLRAPCWLGEDACVGPAAVIGPRAILEDRVFVEGGAEIADSIVGPETFVGKLTRITESLAWGNRLVNWRSGAAMEVPDRFLLGALNPQRLAPGPSRRLGRLTGLLAGAVTLSLRTAKSSDPRQALSSAMASRPKLFPGGMPVSLSEQAATPSSNK